MLTNNKKRSFVKLIALTLAALMVFSVCLTGCTDQDARDQAADALNKAESAQTAADAAQTADEVAAAITKALEGYYKGSADDIKAIVTAELQGVVTADDLAKYAEKTALDALTTKVNGLTTGLTEEQVKTLINKALADVAVDKKIKDAIDGAGILSADDVKGLIQEALDQFGLKLNDYVKKDELDAYVTDEDLKAYFGDKTPAEIFTALDTLIEEYEGEHMSGDDWNKATKLVVETLELASTFVSSDIVNRFYLDENKYQINKLSGIKMFPSNGVGADGKADTEDDSYGAYDAAAASNAMAVIALNILRAPDVETIEAIKNGFEEAAKVPYFEIDLAKIVEKLYALGTLATLDTDRNGTADKYTAAAKYHGVAYANGADKKYQVVTDADKAAFTAIRQELDALLLHYAADLDDEATSTSAFDFRKADIYVKYTLKKADGSVLDTKLVKAVDYKGNAYSNPDAVDAKTLISGADSAVLVADSYTVRVADGTPDSVFTYTAPAAGMYMTNFFDKLYSDPEYSEPKINVDAAGYTAVSGNLANALNRCSVAGDQKIADTYAAIIQMLNDVDNAMNAAKTTFNNFLTKVAGADKADDVYVNALKDYMCTSEYLDGAIYVPTAWNDDTDHLRLLEKVAAAFNYAANIRGGTTDGLFKYDLFKTLQEKANELLFEQYRDRALDVLDTMMNDYITAVEAAKLAVANNSTPEDQAQAALNDLGLDNNNGTVDAGERWSPDFVAKFYAANSTFTWKLGTDNQKMIGLNQFMENNGAAYIPNGTTNTAVACDILKVLADRAVAIKHELSAATIGPRNDILSAEVDNMDDDDVVSEAFDAYIDTAKQNLDEIIYRWTFDEIKDGVLNSLYALVTGDVAFDTFFTNGIAFFYNDGSASGVNYTAIANALENYLTGYSKTADERLAAGDQVAVATKNLDAKTLPANLVSPDMENPVMTYGATAMVTEVLDLRKAAVLDMENIAIKLRFGDYLDEARRTLWFTYNAYKSSAQDYSMANEITTAYNAQLNEISGIEYKAYMSDLNDLDAYKQLYVDLLYIVMRHDSTYWPLLGDKTVAELISENAKSKDATGYTGIVQPVPPFAGAPSYYSAGTAIQAFDQAANRDAYKQVDGTVEYLYRR